MRTTPEDKQLSVQELAWCRSVARRLRQAYEKYLYACQLLRGSRPVLSFRPSRELPATNRVEQALITKIAWEEFLESLTPEERELLSDVVEGGLDYFTRVEKKLLRRMDRMAQEFGV